ncbi:MAG: trypsin-like peptidase domain-containing protein [Oscillospiraceae bacterium]|nr:trypsin-like peptidase domain-containing protein [Oscillospiraceae bacterium]
MYEENNNNNYTYEANYTPTEPEKPKNSGGKKAGKIFAFILAVVLIGGASGFGGALLANSMNSDNISTSEVNKKEADEEEETINTVTAAPQNSTNDDATLGNLLNVESVNGVLTTEQIIHNATPSVVLITSEFTEAQGSGTGTGIVLSADGYIITNCHVIETSYQTYQSSGDMNPFENPFSFFGGGYEAVTQTAQADKVTITMSDGSEHEAEIIGSDENTDLALLKIDVDGLIPAVLGNSDDLNLGESAITLGYPVGLGLSASEGIVSGLEKELTTELSSGGTATMTLIQTDASINPGNSGGPLLNSRGEVIGITSSKLVDSTIEGIGFAIPITDAMPILEDLMNKGYVSTPKIGITGSDITSAVKRYYNLPVDAGVLVVSVEEGSCADIAGIAEGDVIVAADGKEISDMNGLVAAKNKHKPGETMTVTLARSDGNIDIDIVLDETPNEEADQ